MICKHQRLVTSATITKSLLRINHSQHSLKATADYLECERLLLLLLGVALFDAFRIIRGYQRCCGLTLLFGGKEKVGLSAIHVL